MAAVHLPVDCCPESLLDAVRTQLEEPPVDRLTIWIPEGCFVDCGAIAFLATWLQLIHQMGVELSFRGDLSAIRYLSRMDLFEQVGVSFDETFERHEESGRFTPVRLVHDGEAVYSITNEILELIVQQFDNAPAFLPAVEWSVYEIIDNILLHAESPAPGAVCAQYFPNRQRLDIAVCDMGRGIRASLGSVLQPWEGHGAAIQRAMQRGVTRDPEIGQGNGLAGAVEIVERNAGSFQMWTGDAIYHIRDGEHRGFTAIPEFTGTGVVLKLDTRRPVDLTETFIGHSDWTYLDRIVDSLSEDAGLDVADECINLGTREPAKRLRRKILNLLPGMDQPLVLDFAGVEQTSSSFLDELLGRLARELGREEFEQKIRLSNVAPLVLQMAEVVVEQRLAGN